MARENQVTNHYGIWVGSEQPTTGVFNTSEPEWFHEEIFYGDCTNLTYLDALEEYKANPQEYLEYGIENENDFNEQYENMGQDTLLVGGWIQGKDGLWKPDPSSEYSVIVGEIYGQIVHSLYIERAELCSPCYPGQASLGSGCKETQVYRAYTLPPSLWGEGIDNERLQSLRVETLLYWGGEYTRSVREYLKKRLPIRRVKELTERVGKVLEELSK